MTRVGRQKSCGFWARSIFQAVEPETLRGSDVRKASVFGSDQISKRLSQKNREGRTDVRTVFVIFGRTSTELLPFSTKITFSSAWTRKVARVGHQVFLPSSVFQAVEPEKLRKLDVGKASAFWPRSISKRLNPKSCEGRTSEKLGVLWIRSIHQAVEAELLRWSGVKKASVFWPRPISQAVEPESLRGSDVRKAPAFWPGSILQAVEPEKFRGSDVDPFSKRSKPKNCEGGGPKNLLILAKINFPSG